MFHSLIIPVCVNGVDLSLAMEANVFAEEFTIYPDEEMFRASVELGFVGADFCDDCLGINWHIGFSVLNIESSNSSLGITGIHGSGGDHGQLKNGSSILEEG